MPALQLVKPSMQAAESGGHRGVSINFEGRAEIFAFHRRHAGGETSPEPLPIVRGGLPIHLTRVRPMPFSKGGFDPGSL